MANQHRQADGLFQLSALPVSLWPMARVARELKADDQTIRRWVREGRLSRPCLRRNVRVLWNPADVASFRRIRLHRIGAE